MIDVRTTITVNRVQVLALDVSPVRPSVPFVPLDEEGGLESAIKNTPVGESLASNRRDGRNIETALLGNSAPAIATRFGRGARNA